MSLRVHLYGCVLASFVAGEVAENVVLHYGKAYVPGLMLIGR